ncbi:Oxidoreductase family, C-terminal alpha/beta domain [Pilibacter termitis]|uniref:Oxidoreductase family, C-terminal alpha/beta domain n=1 Tax=Pilibacter termitis TaxID=263852 RepID=A0A1T4KR49_9ENTE|nr:Gfo/Idh/MocA family oxidoreductase [Pilibacter termitis]SJZ44929.1 Oxidoreductase family, C-terminal alpha/beta domain [Pilibacter termitis]
MKKTYVQVGIGGRARFFYEAIAKDFRETSELIGFCDISQVRMDYANRLLSEKYNYPKVATYFYTDFDKMLDELQPDYVIVTSVDRTHHEYIIRAMEKGCDVLSEKPMTIDAEKAAAILKTQEETGKNLRVTFNYRYAPHNTKIAELLRSGVIGDVFSVHFEWLLNTEHGADYFRRWHRNKYNSGGLLVHKSTHHFDLVNFWLQSSPKTVFAFGELNFYGMKNAEKRGVTQFYSRSYGSAAAKEDPFSLDLTSNEELRELYLNAEEESGYIRDRSVFSDDISIEDTLAVTVQYENKAVLTYSLNAYMPYEGFKVAFNGSKGRIEMTIIEKSYVNAGGKKEDEGALAFQEIKVFPMFLAPYIVEIETLEGGHGGGDPILLNDLFGTPEIDPLNRQANHLDGVKSILTGIAANQSIASGLPVKIKDLQTYK